jgi:HD-like signal output (HDOD) protein
MDEDDMSALKPSPEQLQFFRPLNSLSVNQLVLASANSEVKEYGVGETVFEIGSDDGLEHFLLKGTVELESFDGRFKSIEAGSESAQAAIALLRPRKYTARTKTPCVFIIIENKVIEALLRELPELSEVDFSVSSIKSGHEVQDILESFKYDLEHNTIKLPSFPDVALEIRRLVDSPDSSIQDVTKVLANDPAITVKLIKTCNCPLYRRAQDIHSAHDAVVRLGLNTTRQLVTVFAMNEVFNSTNKVFRNRMKKFWEHAREVAAVSYVLGKITPGLDPEMAMLAGLIKDIGTIPILNYIERYPQFVSDEEKVEAILVEMQSKVGSILLKHWGFQQELVDVAVHTEDWMYDSRSSKASYSDVIIAAEVHSMIGKIPQQNLPKFSDIPAFKKLGDGGLTAEQSQAVMAESHQQIKDLKTLLGASA